MFTFSITLYPGVLPESHPCGTDFEKNNWTPGIYDNVSLLAGDNPMIETIQVAVVRRNSVRAQIAIS